MNDTLFPSVVPVESRDFCAACDEWMAYRRKGITDAYLQTLENRVKATYQLLPPVKIGQGGKSPSAVKMHPWDLP